METKCKQCGEVMEWQWVPGSSGITSEPEPPEHGYYRGECAGCGRVAVNRDEPKEITIREFLTKEDIKFLGE